MNIDCAPFSGSEKFLITYLTGMGFAPANERKKNFSLAGQTGWYESTNKTIKLKEQTPAISN